jgi:hypothetical protein
MREEGRYGLRRWWRQRYVYKLLRARSFFVQGESFNVYGSRNGTMWYLIDTFLQPRTDKCWSVSSRGASTLPTSAIPDTAVLQRSSLVSIRPYGFTTLFSRASKA